MQRRRRRKHSTFEGNGSPTLLKERKKQKKSTKRYIPFLFSSFFVGALNIFFYKMGLEVLQIIPNNPEILLYE